MNSIGVFCPHKIPATQPSKTLLAGSPIAIAMFHPTENCWEPQAAATLTDRINKSILPKILSTPLM